jgi:hypothetical protein
MSKEKVKWGLNTQTEKEFNVFNKNGETFMSFKFVINDPTLSDSTKILFQYVYGSAARTGYCDLSNNSLVEDAGLTGSAVKSGIKALKQKGWLKTEMISICTGSKRRISIVYHALRKACPRKNQEYNMKHHKDFAKNKKGKFHPNAIATYVLCNNHDQMFKSIRPILYDRSLPPLARVLFQIIGSLSVKKGYCFAMNYFFTEKLGGKSKYYFSTSNSIGKRGDYQNFIWR